MSPSLERLREREVLREIADQLLAVIGSLLDKLSPACSIVDSQTRARLDVRLVSSGTAY